MGISFLIYLGIIGGGIGGCAFALALQQKNIPFKIYERDESFDSRKQGYGFTIQQGVTALRKLGFTAVEQGIISTIHESYSSDGVSLGAYGYTNIVRKILSSKSDADLPKIFSSNSSSYVDIMQNKRHNIHLPRQKLREQLLSKLNLENVLWSKKLVHILESNSSSDSSNAQYARDIALTFEDGSTDYCSVVVGADGIYSLVRQFMFPDQPLEYLGLMVILGISTISPYEYTSNSSYVPINNVFSGSPTYNEVVAVRQWLDGNSRIFSMPFDKDNVMWQMSFPVSEADALHVSQNAVSLKDEAVRRCGGWHKDVQRLLERTDLSLLSGHPVYDRTPVTADKICLHPKSRITLLGDAAHPMSPFKGQGANQALVDAVNLAEAISRSDVVRPSNAAVSDCLRAYETEMCERSARKVWKSRRAATILHSAAAMSEGDRTRASVAEDAEGGRDDLR